MTPSTLITCHSNADWDALASMVSLRLLYPDSILLFPGSMEPGITKYFNEVLSLQHVFKTPREVDPASIRRLVLADTQQYGRVPHVHAFVEREGPRPEIHIWDHHPDKDPGLRPTLVRCEPLGSTCTLICRALREEGISPSSQDATLLGLGIYGDTGSFAYNSTQAEDLEAAAWLRRHGMDVAFIAELVSQNITSEQVRLLSALLDSAKAHEAGPYTVLLAEAAMDGFVPNFAYLAQQLMEMEPCDVLFALANMDDKIQVVARSRVEELDVGRVCKALGGGGHRYAASATVRDCSLAELKDSIFQQIFTQVNPHRVARDLMSSPVVSLSEHQSINEASVVMNRYGLKAAPVLRQGRNCVGYMEGQIAAKAIAHGLGAMPVMEYMQRKVFVVSPETSLQRLIDIIVGGRQRLVPVAERGEVIGVVTRTDLINLFVDEPGRIPLPAREAPRERELGRLLTTRLPKAMLHLLKQAGELGDKLQVNVYAVGGFVRDVLLSRPATQYDDVDLVVEGDGIAFARELALTLKGRVREHQTFMTALIIYPDENGQEQRLDVATARLEYYQYPAALPVVELSSIKMDLFRRDFTINAMALRLNAGRFGRLVDFFGGQGDIQRKTIRIIHSLSFVEDPTRIIRAVRFSQRYGFRLSVQCEKLIKNVLLLQLIEKLSGARILHELELIFHEQAPHTCLERLDSLGVLQAIHPSLVLSPERRALLETLREVLDWYRLLYLDTTPDLVQLHLLALSSAISAAEAEEILNRLGLSAMLRQQFLSLREKIRQTLPRLLTWQKNSGKVSALHALLSPLPLEGHLYLMARARNKDVTGSVSQYIYKWRAVKIDVGGADLKALGLASGPLFSEILRRVLAAKLDGEVETRDEQLALVRRLAHEIPPDAFPQRPRKKGHPDGN